MISKKFEYHKKKLSTCIFHYLSVPDLCSKARAKLNQAKAQFETLATKIPANQYFRFNDHCMF